MCMEAALETRLMQPLTMSQTPETNVLPWGICTPAGLVFLFLHLLPHLPITVTSMTSVTCLLSISSPLLCRYAIQIQTLGKSQDEELMAPDSLRLFSTTPDRSSHQTQSGRWEVGAGRLASSRHTWWLCASFPPDSRTGVHVRDHRVGAEVEAEAGAEVAHAGMVRLQN